MRKGQKIVISVLVFLIVFSLVYFFYNRLGNNLEECLRIADKDLWGIYKNNSSASNKTFEFEFALRDYRCQLEKEWSKDVYDEATAFIEKTAFPDPDFKARKKDFLKDSYFSSVIINGELGEICPDKMTKVCQEARTLPEFSNVIEPDACPKICEMFLAKDDDPDRFKKEIFNFEGRNDSFDQSLFAKLVWRLAVIQRFYGYEGTSGFCDDLAGASKQNCLAIARTFKIESLGCDNLINEAKKYHCERNYFSF